MPRVPHPDPLYPVVWADTPTVPDSPATPVVSGLPEDDDPIQLHLDEALVRKADNDTVDRWKTLSGPWFAARGGDAASRWKDIEQSLNEIVRRPLGELDTVWQRNMYRDIMGPRLSAWGDEARAHAERETQAFNDAESQRRQDIALEAMRRGARLGDMRAVAEGERRLVGEVRGRSRRQGLDPDAASAAETDARGAAHADVVEHLTQHDPQRAQAWLNAHAGMIADPVEVDRLSRMMQPYVAEQQQEGLADLIRDEGGDLPAQHAAVDAMGLNPMIADGLKQRLTNMWSAKSANEYAGDMSFGESKPELDGNNLELSSDSDFHQIGFRPRGGLAGLVREALRETFRYAMPKIKFPTNGAGIGQAEFGSLAGLSKADRGWRVFTRAETEAGIRRLKSAGITKSEVSKVADFYSYTAFRDIGNEAAAFRSYYLQQIVRRW
ncbi:hypothetical protein [Flavisphingomonas formosensis]|uniref:hypothetical protein n=1 Tax=Flavisphingomonas formosensis TaxID=861534 RepID=UPI0012F8A348|nr:hypothetical protein [Sphingomonas formosensis]